MGCGSSASSKRVAAEVRSSRESDTEREEGDNGNGQSAIKIEKANFEKHDVKVLFLGAGESGKSTIVRQIKRLYCGGFAQIDRKNFKSIISTNILSDFQLLIDNLRSSTYKYPESLDPSMDTIKELDYSDPIDTTIGELISQVWDEQSMKMIFDESNSIGISENFDYFLDKIMEICEPDYVPTDLDILKSRIRTTGSADLKILMNNLKVRFVDIGGQKNERRQWETCFSNLDYVVFVQSLSDFDQVLFEDGQTSRVEDSLSVWKMVCTNPMIRDLPIFFVFNKNDLLEKKLLQNKEAFLRAYPGFKGDPSDINQCRQHIQTTFMNQIPSEKKGWVETEFTCAMDDGSIAKLMNDIATHILTERNKHV